MLKPQAPLADAPVADATSVGPSCSVAEPANVKSSAPSLWHDPAFWGLNLTQFLGAFNDNLFKQLVMLICVDRARDGGQDMQGLAMILFAWPFIAFSGFAGFLSDRFSKRRIIVLCKAAEFLIVVLGLVGFTTGNLSALLAVLCLMGVHSAFFGPSKYGILPEILRSGDLPRANGMILMATFLAIIFGLSAAGAAKQAFEATLWMASIPCLVIALTGIGTSLLIRPTPIAQPHLTFDWSSVAIAADTRVTLRSNPTLLGVLLMSSVFWFVGGTVYPPAINAFGKDQLRLDDLTTGIMAASTGLGIAVGCVLAGILSKNRVRSWLVRTGAWGLAFSLAALAIPGPGLTVVREEIRQGKATAAIRTSQADVNNSEGTIHGISLPPGPDLIANTLASRISIHQKNVPLKQVIDQIAKVTGRNIVCSYGTIGVSPETLVSVSVVDVPLLQALEQLFHGHGVDYGQDHDRLLIDSFESPPLHSTETLASYQSAAFYRGSLLGPYGSVVALIAVGIFAGFYSVPLQVYLQTAAPADQKGRIIGANNLLNWIGIAGSGFVYMLGRQLLVGWLQLPHAALFGFAGFLMLPVALLYRPPETQAVNQGTES